MSPLFGRSIGFGPHSQALAGVVLFLLILVISCDAAEPSESPESSLTESPDGANPRVPVPDSVVSERSQQESPEIESERPGSEEGVVRFARSDTNPPASILDLQPFRRVESRKMPPESGLEGLELIHVNPNVNRWLVLQESLPGGEKRAFHLENVAPRSQQIQLATSGLEGLRIASGSEVLDCLKFAGPEDDPLMRAAASKDIYSPLCDGRLYLRNPAQGSKTSVEWATDFLRNYVWGGEQITVLVRDVFFNDAYLKTSELSAGKTREAPKLRPRGAPLRPRIKSEFEGRYLAPTDLGMRLDSAPEKLLVGRWYPALDLPGIFVSAVQPNLVVDVQPEFAEGTLVNRLDEVESSAMAYLIGFDLEQFALEFSLGTDHPSLGWSTRIPETMLDSRLPGPDGIENSQPLVRTGKISPIDAQRIVASFVGGFKRYHGAFRYGDLSRQNRGTHYGFIQSGAVFSRLQPGLATLLVLDDGSVALETWTAEDDARLQHVQHARQNGLPLIETDVVTGRARPGRFVAEPRLGNWSGSVEGRYRTVRSGVCLQESPEGRFLIYGFFSSATAGVLARVFQAYQCSYAMLLDINALEHTYSAVYRLGPQGLEVEQLIRGMDVLEKSSRGKIIPRFVGYADNRDFFYLLRKGPGS